MQKKLASLFLCALGAIGAVSYGLFANTTVYEIQPVLAASHPANYDPYVYSGNYYSGISGTGASLRAALTTLIHPTSVPKYSGTGDNTLAQHLQKADEDPTNSSNMIYLYTRNSVKKNAAGSWNREHVWPQSLSNNCWGQGRAGADMLHLRPTYNTTNSTRSNDLYGEVTGGTERVYNGITYGYSKNGYFMPLDSVKGDVARICMYVWVAYHDEYLSRLPALTKVFQSMDVLMSWHIQDKPDVMEGNRNNYVESSTQGNRNPFVDHPEYAWKIFGDKEFNLSQSVYNQAVATYPDSGYNPTPGPGEDPTTPAANGCGGNVMTTSITLSAIALVGAVTLFAREIVKKKKEN